MTQDPEDDGMPGTAGAPAGRWSDESHSFIVRVRITTAPEGAPFRRQFSLEDVSAEEVTRHTSLDRLLRQLSDRITKVTASPAQRGSLQ